MTDLDERLAEALRAAVPEPPHQLDPQAIRDRSVRRRRPLRRYAPALAAAVVVAVAVGIALTRGGGGDADNNPATAGNPRDLFGFVWRVQTIDGVHAGRFDSVTLDIKPSGVYLQNYGTCYGLNGKLSWTQSKLIVEATHRFAGNCIAFPGQPRLRGHLDKVMHQLFTGDVAWSVDGNRLTLSKAGGPTIVYHRWRYLGEPGTFIAELELDQTTAPANGEPIPGTLYVDNETGAPIVISDACNGWHAVGLVNDQVTFNSGWPQVACASGEIPVGTTEIPIQVNTTYNQCQMNPRDPIGPHCVGPEHTEMPPLPPGAYTTRVEFRGLSRDPTLGPSVNVTLTAP